MRTIEQILGPADVIWDECEQRSKALSLRGGDVYLVAHHSVSRTLQSILDTFKSSNRSVSANSAVGPLVAGQDAYQSRQTVPWNTHRAYTTSSWIDDIAITFEMANLALSPPWPVGQTGKRWAAELAAAMHVELGMPLDRWHVTCHSEIYERGWDSYATACCGDDLRNALDWVVEEAKRIVAGTGTQQQQEADMRVINWNGRVFTVGPEQIAHETNYDFAKATKNMLGQAEFEKVDNGSMMSTQLSLGIPWYAVDAVLKGLAFDIDGTPGKGHFWSRQLEIAAAIKGLDGIGDQDAVLATIRQSLAEGLAGVDLTPDIDLAAVANAVNDEAAQRMQG